MSSSLVTLHCLRMGVQITTELGLEDSDEIEVGGREDRDGVLWALLLGQAMSAATPHRLAVDTKHT